MRTINGVKFTRFLIYFILGFSYDTRKDKTKLTHQFCSLFQFPQLFHFTIVLKFYIGKIRIGQNSLSFIMDFHV